MFIQRGVLKKHAQLFNLIIIQLPADEVSNSYKTAYEVYCDLSVLFICLSVIFSASRIYICKFLGIKLLCFANGCQNDRLFLRFTVYLYYDFLC